MVDDKPKRKRDEWIDSWRFPRPFFYEVEADPQTIVEVVKTLEYSTTRKAFVVNSQPFEDQTGYTFEFIERHRHKGEWHSSTQVRGRISQQGSISVVEGVAQINESRFYGVLAASFSLDAILLFMALFDPMNAGETAAVTAANVIMLLIALFLLGAALKARDKLRSTLANLFAKFEAHSHAYIHHDMTNQAQETLEIPLQEASLSRPHDNYH